MSRGPRLNDDEKNKIRLIYQGMPSNVTAEEVRIQASQLLGREFGLSTVQRELVGPRKKRSQNPPELPLDKPWSLGAVTQFPYLETSTLLLICMKNFLQLAGMTMSIRWATWFCRLINTYRVSSDDFTDILLLTTGYTAYESIWEQSGLPLPADTGQLDNLEIKKAKQNLINWLGSKMEPSTKAQWENSIKMKETVAIKEWQELVSQLTNNNQRSGERSKL
jgi:hypothetical protein